MITIFFFFYAHTHITPFFYIFIPWFQYISFFLTVTTYSTWCEISILEPHQNGIKCRDMIRV